MNKFGGKVTIRLDLIWFLLFWVSKIFQQPMRRFNKFLGPFRFVLYLLLSKFRLSPCLKQQLGWGWLACWGFCTPKQRGWASEGAWILTRSRSRLSCTFHMSPACDASEMIALLVWSFLLSDFHLHAKNVKSSVYKFYLLPGWQRGGWSKTCRLPRKVRFY